MPKSKRRYIGYSFNKNMPVRTSKLKPMKGKKPLGPHMFAKHNPLIPSNTLVFFDAATYGERSFTQAILFRNDLNGGSRQICHETGKSVSLPWGQQAEMQTVKSGRRTIGHAVIPVPKAA